MKEIAIETIYERLSGISVKPLLLLSQNYKDVPVLEKDSTKTHTYKLRQREDELLLHCERQGIRCFHDVVEGKKAEEIALHSAQAIIVAGESLYRSIGIVSRLRASGCKSIFFVEYDEGSTNAKSIRSAVELAKLRSVTDVLFNLVYLTKLRRSPRKIDVDIDEFQPSSISNTPMTKGKKEVLPRSLKHSVEDIPTPTAIDLELPERVETTTYRVLRDSELSRRIKALHNYECQICGHSIILQDGRRYCEAHHIRPLGNMHQGRDIEGNILCVCPNHHTELDYGVRYLSLEEIHSHSEHIIALENIEYHNNLVRQLTLKQSVGQD